MIHRVRFLSRRRLLLWVLLLPLLWGFLRWGWFARSSRSFLRGILYERLSYVSAPEGVVEQFLDDALRVIREDDLNRATYFSAFAIVLYPFERLGWMEYSESLEEFKEGLARQFLLSTDFFYGKTENSAELRYLGWHNPYERPCANPFATFG